MNEISGGAATFSLHKAQAMPKIMMDLLVHSVEAGSQPLAAKDQVAPPGVPSLAAVAGKGQHIDLVV